MKILCLSILAGVSLLQAQSVPPTPLQSGALVSVAFPIVTVPTLFADTYSYSIKVPAGATRLEINLSSTFDLDLYVRYGHPVAYGDDGGVIADYRSETVGGNESVVISGTPMQAGTYYIAIKVSTLGIATSGFLIATTTVGCQYNLETSELSLTSAGGAGSISVLSTPACAWTAVASAPWITITSHGSGISSGLVGFQVAVNTGAARIGVITIGGQVFTVRQAGVGQILVPDNAQLISQFVAGGGWSMDVFVTNLSSTSDGFTMSFYNADGTPRTMPIQGAGTVGSITRSVAAGETQKIQTGAADALQQGWAVLVPNSPNTSRLSGFAIFRLSLAANPSEAIVPFMDPKQNRFVILYDNANGFVTGAALANPSSTLTLTITATARDLSGQQVGSPLTITLPPLARIAFAVPDRFQGTAGLAGSIYLSGSSGITGLGLRFSPQGTFSSFPLLTSSDIE